MEYSTDISTECVNRQHSVQHSERRNRSNQSISPQKDTSCLRDPKHLCVWNWDQETEPRHLQISVKDSDSRNICCRADVIRSGCESRRRRKSHRSNGQRIQLNRTKLCEVDGPCHGSPVERFLHEDIFNVRFTDIEKIPNLRHLKYGFVDEEDFEDFKQDLLFFREIKQNRRTFCKRNPSQRLSKTAGSRSSHKSSDQFMEFFNSDEHFQEFERVFETFKSKRFSDSLDRLRMSLRQYEDSDEDIDDDDKTIILDEEDLSYLDDPQDDIFSEFFDNDEDFKEFERELQTFKVKRRSRVIDKINRISGCDIVTELKAHCDKDPTEKYDALIAAGEPRLWNSGGEWDYIFKHINRGNRRSTDLSATYGSNTSIQTLGDYDSDTGVFTSDTELHISEDCSQTYNQSAQNNSNNDDCNFTCHQKCAQMVRLNCKSSPGDMQEEPESLETSLSEVSDTSHNASNDGATDASNEKDETDSGYRSGTIPDEKLPRQPSQATLNREELKKKLEEYNTLVPGANMQLKTEKGESFQGFIKVTLNLVRPICMSLGARPPSIYEVLTKEHIVEQNTQTISFYMPRDTVKSIHVASDVTTKEVISLLLKKFHILDNPRKFALYEQELSVKGKIVRLRRIPETSFPLHVSLEWEPEKIENIRFVLQENESGEVNWDAFSLPELNNFLRVLDREESEYTSQLEYKYKVMKRIVQQRLKELRKEKRNSMLSKNPSQEHRNSAAES